MSKRIKALLIVSLAFNLLIVGMFAGRHFGVMKGFRHHYGPYGYILHAAPKEKHAEIKVVLEKLKSDFPRRHTHRRQIWKAFSVVLREDKFDREKFMAVAAEQAAKRSQNWRKHAELIAEIAEILSPGERREMVEKIDKKMSRKRWGFKRHWHRNHDPKPQ